ncbi:hypothetical protein GCM10010436_44230 [Paractinoplanes durhamensis]
MPPVRVTRQWPDRRRCWEYDTWGSHGRPVVFIPAILFGRTSWWAVAADLRLHATVIAVDLPGHGNSARRQTYEPHLLVDELAALIADLRIPQAPVIVAHGPSATLAELFASRYAAHAVVTVDAEPDPPVDRPGYLQHMQPASVPRQYRSLATPTDDGCLLHAYRGCLQRDTASTTRVAANHQRLAIHSSPPAARLRPAAPDGRLIVYDVPGRFPQLSAVDRFTADIRSVLRPRNPSAPARPEPGH